jgi:hypothetical protein
MERGQVEPAANSQGTVRGLPTPGPTAESFGGVRATLSPQGEFLPVPKRRRVTRSPHPDRSPAAPQSVPIRSNLESSSTHNSNPLRLTTQQSDDLGTYIVRDSKRLLEVGFDQLVEERRGRSDFHPKVKTLNHKAARLLDHLRTRGANVKLSTPPWSEERRAETLKRGPHKSANEHAKFLREELLDFVKKGFWLVLPYHLLKKYE